MLNIFLQKLFLYNNNQNSVFVLSNMQRNAICIIFCGTRTVDYHENNLAREEKPTIVQRLG